MVEDVYTNYPHRQINRIWVIYQSVLNEMIKCHGNNDYRIPHMNKAKLEREKRLPGCLNVCEEGVAWLKQLYPDLYSDTGFLADVVDTDSTEEEWDNLNAHVEETVAAGSEFNNL